MSGDVLPRSTSEGYEAFEPLLNGRRVILLDVPVLEQQLMGLCWRGSKIDHPPGEHDDWANACTAVAVLVLARKPELQVYASSGKAKRPPESNATAEGPSGLMDSHRRSLAFGTTPTPAPDPGRRWPRVERFLRGD